MFKDFWKHPLLEAEMLHLVSLGFLAKKKRTGLKKISKIVRDGCCFSWVVASKMPHQALKNTLGAYLLHRWIKLFCMWSKVWP